MTISEAEYNYREQRKFDALTAEVAELKARIDKQDERCSLLQGESDELRSRIDKVLALHSKTTEEMLDHKCANGDCGHEDECPSMYVDVCSCCSQIAQQVSDEYWPASMAEIIWPCPTVAALTQGGEQ